MDKMYNRNNTRDKYVSLCLAIVLIITISLPKYYDDNKRRENIQINLELSINNNIEPLEQPPPLPIYFQSPFNSEWSWSGCPRPDQMLVTVKSRKGRLGNTVQEYLSAWALAQTFNLWPVMPRESLTMLSIAFENLKMLTIEDVSTKCPGFTKLKNIFENSTTISREDFIQKISNPQSIKNEPVLLNLDVKSVIHNEFLLHWAELPHLMTLKYNRIVEANIIMTQIFNEAMKNRTTGGKEVEFVGVHVRRTDYTKAIKKLYPGAKVANEKYYLNAMDWMRKKLEPSPIVFVLITDDIPWCRKKFKSKDIVFAGTGLIESPGLDLAILSLCNHTIFAYGTFGLCAAMLTQGQYTLLFDTENGTETDEMKYAPFLQGWHVLNTMGIEKNVSNFNFY